MTNNSSPFYILSAVPSEAIKLEGIFESEDGLAMRLLRYPGGLRRSGWDLETLDNPRIVQGEYLEVKNGERKIIRVYEDGTFIFRCAADQDFLGWPLKEEEFKEEGLLNPLAIIEVTFNFVNFYKELIEKFKSQFSKVYFKIEIKNAQNLSIAPGGIKSFSYMFKMDRKPAPSDNMSRDFEIDLDSLLSRVPYVAYKLVKSIYNWFSLTDQDIPYVSKDGNGESFIDKEKIIHA